jgi:hypothetical protein
MCFILVLAGAPERAAPRAGAPHPCSRWWLAKPYDHQDMVRALADARDRSRDLEL